MTTAPGPEATDWPEGDDVLEGDLVRELVARHEAEIADLETRLAAAESDAAEAERAVRRHPALVLLHPDEARDLLPEPSGPSGAGGRPPATTVVRREVAVPVVDRNPVTRPADGHASPAPEPAGGGLGARIVRSHWWWRVGIVLVVVALLLLKLG